MGTIRVGTTSWTEKTLIESGRFYPPEVASAEARLRYYASRFPVVEVDSSYYGLPSERNAILWRERTPEGFIFDVKAFRLFTRHQTPPSALPRDIREAIGSVDKKNLYYENLAPELRQALWRRFRSALEPLRAAGKLGVVLFQFPPWFVYRPAHLDHILECKENLGGLTVAVEFRNRSWFEKGRQETVLAFEREHNLAHVVVDEPQGIAGSIPAVWATTSTAIAVVRLHGRNRENWLKKGLSAAERFNYLYSNKELNAFVEPIRRLSEHSGEVHALFNNCYRDNAQRNALRLQGLLETG